MIIGILTQVEDAEGALNNLAEADFKPSHISVVMADKEQANAISDTSGILTGTPVEDLADALVKLGLKKDALRYQDMVKKGGVFMAVSTESKDEEEAVKEILKGQNGRLVKKI
ncbi:MAG: hypothetical protein ACM3SR_06125 [Ignavibacteriales bacterium]|jgi:hypothetical protein